MRRAGSLMREIIGLGRGTARVAGRFSGYSCTARNTLKAFAGRDLRRNLAPNSRLDLVLPDEHVVPPAAPGASEKRRRQPAHGEMLATGARIRPSVGGGVM